MTWLLNSTWVILSLECYHAQPERTKGSFRLTIGKNGAVAMSSERKGVRWDLKNGQYTSYF